MNRHLWKEDQQYILFGSLKAKLQKNLIKIGGTDWKKYNSVFPYDS